MEKREKDYTLPRVKLVFSRGNSKVRNNNVNYLLGFCCCWHSDEIFCVYLKTR